MNNTSNEETGYYKRVIGATRCNNGFRGFRLNIKKLSIQRLRVRFIHFLRVLFKWRKSYDRVVKSFKKGISCGRRNCYAINSNTNNNTINSYNNSGSKSRLIISDDQRKMDCRLRSLGRTNSFYTEAIADCLEFIKRNSYSADENEAAPIVAALR